MNASRSLKICNALVLDPLSPAAETRDVLVLDGYFASEADALASGIPDADMQRIDATGQLMVPGLVNAHTHSPLNILKGTGDVLNHRAFMWLNQADTAGRSPEEVELSALLGCMEHLLCGTTSVIDHFPEQGFTIADVDAVVGAYDRAGLRGLVALRVFDQPYDDIMPQNGLPQASTAVNPLQPAPLSQTIELLQASISRHHRSASGRISIAPGPSNPMRCSDDLLSAVQALADRHDTPVHIHLLETAVQAHIAQKRYGRTMVQHLDLLGVLGPRLSCAHTIWIDDHDIALMAERGAVVVHNPESNCKLGAGIAPVSRMLAAGVTVALGTDGASTNDNLDLHETMRFAAMLQRPFEPERRRWPSARDALQMATTAGGKAMRIDALGRIERGAPADFVLHDLGDPSWIPLNDPLTQLVFTATGSSVRTVVVDGRILVRDRKILAFDPEPVLKEARNILKRLRDCNAPIYALASRLGQEF